MQQMVGTTHRMVGTTHELQSDMGELRDHMADFDDFWRPLRNYLYWEPHCFDIPLCWSIRSIFDGLDGIDEVTTKMQGLVKELDQLDLLMPQMLLQFPQMIATMQSTRTMMLTMHSTMSGLFTQMDESSDNSTAMGKAFDASNNDDSFYLPPEAFDNPDFKRGLKLFMSPDGKAARMIITHEGTPATPEGISHIDAIKDSAFDAIKATPLSDAKIYVAGTASAYKDIQDGAKYDLLIAALAAISLI
nr:MMPL family transporter [Streptomyces sp. DSM 41633]